MTVIHETEWYAACPVGTVLVDERGNEYTKTAPDTWDTWGGPRSDAELNGSRWGIFTIKTMPEPSNPPTSPISDRAVSYLRTVVPVLWGSAVAWLLTVVVLPAEVTDLLTSDLAITAVTALVVGAWYIAWRWAEPHIPYWLTRLVLGSAQTPIYARHAKIGTLEESAPPTSGTPPGVLQRGDHVTTIDGQGGTVFYVEQREDGWHYGVRLDGSDIVAMYRPHDLT